MTREDFLGEINQVISESKLPPNEIALLLVGIASKISETSKVVEDYYNEEIEEDTSLSSFRKELNRLSSLELSIRLSRDKEFRKKYIAVKDTRC